MQHIRTGEVAAVGKFADVLRSMFSRTYCSTLAMLPERCSLTSTGSKAAEPAEPFS